MTIQRKKNYFSGGYDLISDEFFQSYLDQNKSKLIRDNNPNYKKLDNENYLFHPYPSIPPYVENLQSWYKSRVDSTLVDEVSAANKVVLFPVSEFNGTDGSVEDVFNLNHGDSVSFYRSFSGDAQLEGGSSSVFYWGTLGTGLFRAFLFGVALDFSIDFNKLIFFEFKYVGSNQYEVYADSILKGTITTIVTPSTSIWLGRRQNVASAFVDGIIHGFKVVRSGQFSVPFPHLGIGIDANGDRVDLTVNGGVTEGYSEDGSTHLLDYGCVKEDITNKIIPNSLQGETLAIGENIPSTNFLNKSSLKIDYSSDPIWDKSNVLIWKQPIRDSLNMNLANTFEWDIDEHDQQYIDDNIQPAYAGRVKVVVTNNRVNHILIYNP